jgi:hypothetical protein
VLVIAQEYEIETQAQIISALAVLHNFICIHDPEDLIEDNDNDDHVTTEDSHGGLQNSVRPEERARAVARREEIARAMWADYEARGHCGI